MLKCIDDSGRLDHAGGNTHSFDCTPELASGQVTRLAEQRNRLFQGAQAADDLVAAQLLVRRHLAAVLAPPVQLHRRALLRKGLQHQLYWCNTLYRPKII